MFRPLQNFLASTFPILGNICYLLDLGIFVSDDTRHSDQNCELMGCQLRIHLH